ncbi:hypothetical protein B0H12DRAFT_1210160 [Mycena haematopus]|nr:hypothetical protein B0H12DRAFT_1210160 [Mycena haematopus]
MNSTPPSVSFIVILDFSARWKYLTGSVSDLLGWEPSDLREHSFFELVHPEELLRVQRLHCETISSDEAATTAYMRLKHKDAYKGTVVHDRIVGSVSFGSPGNEVLHANSTAQEITVICPAAANFEFRRWHDPRPVVSRPLSPATSPVPPTALLPPSADLPATQSSRTALILDRFSVNCTITYYSNDQLISSAAATRRPFFDVVARQDEAIVRSWLVAIKTFGVNECGYPSSGGGFGYGRFLLCTEGRDSMASDSPVASTWRRNPSQMRVSSLENTVSVDAIFSAHSDGLVCILRRAQ